MTIDKSYFETENPFPFHIKYQDKSEGNRLQGIFDAAGIKGTGVWPDAWPPVADTPSYVNCRLTPEQAELLLESGVGLRIGEWRGGGTCSIPVPAKRSPTVKPAAPAAPEIGPKVGDTMPDGTILAGISPNTNKPMYATPADAPLTYTFNQAKEYAAVLDANGHKDWRVPTMDELNVLFQNRAAIGGFVESGSLPGGWYWSSSQYDSNFAWDQRFSAGYQTRGTKNTDSSLRCVR